MSDCYVGQTSTSRGYQGASRARGPRLLFPTKRLRRWTFAWSGIRTPTTSSNAFAISFGKSGFDQIEVRKLVGQPASKTPIDHPYAAIIREAVARGFNRKPLIIPSLGGTTPDYVFTKILKIPRIPLRPMPRTTRTIMLPTESTKASLYINGIKTTAHLLSMLAEKPASVTGLPQSGVARA